MSEVIVVTSGKGGVGRLQPQLILVRALLNLERRLL